MIKMPVSKPGKRPAFSMDAESGLYFFGGGSERVCSAP